MLLNRQKSPQFQNEDLLDTYAESFNNAQLIFSTIDEDDETSIIPAPYAVKPFTVDVGNGYFYSAEINGRANNAIEPVVPTVPLIPNASVIVNSTDYDIHPSLLSRRKRKRLDSF